MTMVPKALGAVLLLTLLPNVLTIPVDAIINDALNDWLTSIEEPLYKDLTTINVASDVVLTFYDAEIRGLVNLVSDGSTLVNSTTDNLKDITLTVTTPKLLLNSSRYTCEGLLAGNLDTTSEGPWTIQVDDLYITLSGTAEMDLSIPHLQFLDIMLDLEIWRWWVNLEDFMTGSDMGAVLNEFLMMSGPEIFDIMENNINNSGNLLGWVNEKLPNSPPSN